MDILSIVVQTYIWKSFLLTRKVLVKLEGRFEEYVKPALKQLLALIHKTYGTKAFARSEKAINAMIRRL